MERQEGKDESEQTASDKAFEHQAERLADIERPSNQPPKSKVFAVFNAYLILVGTIIGFGVLAFYTGHKLTADIIFYLSIPLLALIPVALLIYLLPMIRERARFGLDRFENSRFLAFGIRHFARFAYIQYALSLYQVIDGIRTFPKHQRGSLALIALGGFNFIWMHHLVLDITLRKKIYRLQDHMWELSGLLVRFAKKHEMLQEHKPDREKGT
jgi:MFS family permease